MSLPVRWSSGRDPAADQPENGPAPVAVDVRLMGRPEAVAEVTRRLSEVASVDQRFADRPRRDGLGIRRHLRVVLPVGEDSL